MAPEIDQMQLACWKRTTAFVSAESRRNIGGSYSTQAGGGRLLAVPLVKRMSHREHVRKRLPEDTLHSFYATAVELLFCFV